MSILSQSTFISTSEEILFYNSRKTNTKILTLQVDTGHASLRSKYEMQAVDGKSLCR